jgi:hypothetical protein
MSCLTAAGLLSPHAYEAGGWEATDPATEKPVIVFGPFGNAAGADQYAQRIAVVERAVGGGVYVVIAPLTAPLGGVVDGVAGCLGDTTNTGSQTF